MESVGHIKKKVHIKDRIHYETSCSSRMPNQLVCSSSFYLLMANKARLRLANELQVFDHLVQFSGSNSWEQTNKNSKAQNPFVLSEETHSQSIHLTCWSHTDGHCTPYRKPLTALRPSMLNIQSAKLFSFESFPLGISEAHETQTGGVCKYERASVWVLAAVI